MTSFRQRRCAHCQSPYYWQSSGPGCQESGNDAKHCPDCRYVITEALKSVPVRFRGVWEETDEVDVETLLAHRKASLEEHRRRFPDRLIGEQVVAPLFDLRDPENKETSHIVPYNGKTYMVQTWTKTTERNCVKVKMEEEIATGKRRPWRKC